MHSMLRASSPYKNLNWRNVGPDLISGRCTEVLGIPGNKNIIYASFASGGLWKTSDAGENLGAIIRSNRNLVHWFFRCGILPSKHHLSSAQENRIFSGHLFLAWVLINQPMGEKHGSILA